MNEPGKDYISREAAKQLICGRCELNYCGTPEFCPFICDLNAIPAADVVAIPEGGIGELSDGYHTFNELYYQRMILTAALVKAYKGRSWKSYLHEDGELCFGGGWFVVGIDTPEGQYTYHYESKDFDLFDCVELPAAPHWDGHTEKNVTRLLSLPIERPVVRGEWTHKYGSTYKCSACGGETYLGDGMDFCPNCGAKMEGME